MKKSFSLIILAVFLLIVVPVSDAPAEMRLNSDKMEYNPDERTIYASGNVKFSRDRLDIYSDNAEGDLDGSTALFWDSVTGEGFVQDEPVEFSCNKLEAHFKDPVFYALEGDVDATIGTKQIISENLILSGQDIEAKKVERFSDSSQGMTASCERMTGILADDVIEEMILENDVHVEIAGQGGSDTVITGDRAVYSRAKGTLVVTGDARAVQNKRVITAESLVYFPDTRKIEATGRPRIVFPVSGDNG